MNFNKKNKFIGFCIAITLLGFIQNSCESFVEVDLPSSQLTGEAVFQDVATAEATLTHIYSKMRDEVLVQGNSNGLTALLSVYADDLDYYSTNNLQAEEFYLNSLIPSNNTIAVTWNSTYNLIYATNSTIEGITRSTGISNENKNKLIGEAYFIRAYLHFYLVNLFGEIPYVTSTNYEINKSISKISIQQVNFNIIDDLQQAISLLPEDYRGIERTRPNKSTACALMARTQLYNQNWAEAIKYSDKIIENTQFYSWVEDINAVFLNNSRGTIWQLAPQFAGTNTLEAQMFIFFTGPPPLFAITNNLMDSFESGDLRKDYWIGTVSEGSQKWYFPNKYKENGNTSPSVEYSIMFRLEEQYLIRSEASAQLGLLDASKTDLNKIRNRAGLGETTANSKEELLTNILQERRMEFFSELGHRWFDLKRTDNANAVLTNKKPGWDTRDLLWPLPENELLLNENLLPQNLGY